MRTAGALAKLGDGYRVTYLEAEPKGWTRILASLPSAAVRSAAADLGLGLAGGATSQSGAESLRRDLYWLAQAADQTGRPRTYAHCLCLAP